MFFELCLVLLPYRSVVAFPLSRTSAVSPTRTYVALFVIVISICVFFLLVFVVIKLVYMKHRRMGTIHAPVRSVPTMSSPNKQSTLRGFVVGCLGSPTWETHLTSKLDGAWRREQRRRSSFAYQLHAASARSRSQGASSSSYFTTSTGYASCSSQADQLVLPPPSSMSSCITWRRGSNPPRGLLSVQRRASTGGYVHCGDFGEFHGARLPGGGTANVTRRVSPCSIRLVDGPSYSNHVEYSFLSVLPPNAVVRSPLMGTRDSIQLSRCSLKLPSRPAPPLPSLPSFLPFHLPKSPEAVESRTLRGRAYLPPLRFSPLASIAKALHPQHVFEARAQGGRVSNQEESKKGIYSRLPCMESTSWSQSSVGPPTGPCVSPRTATFPIRTNTYKGLAIGGLLRTSLFTDEVTVLDAGSKDRAGIGVLRVDSSCNASVTSRRPLKSCLRQQSAAVACSPNFVESSLHTYRQSCDQASTPISDSDIGILGLDHFHWNDEINNVQVHMKKDSIALVPIWE